MTLQNFFTNLINRLIDTCGINFSYIQLTTHPSTYQNPFLPIFMASRTFTGTYFEFVYPATFSSSDEDVKSHHPHCPRDIVLRVAPLSAGWPISVRKRERNCQQNNTSEQSDRIFAHFGKKRVEIFLHADDYYSNFGPSFHPGEVYFLPEKCDRLRYHVFPLFLSVSCEK